MSSSRSRESVIKEQPSSLPPPAAPSGAHPRKRAAIRAHASHVYDKVTTRHGWLGDYDYAWLCIPTLPFSLPGSRFKRKTRHVGPPFYSLDSELPIVVAATTGLQHALAMLAGLITPPIIFASSLALDSETSAYMISASLIGCGPSSTLTRSLASHSSDRYP